MVLGVLEKSAQVRVNILMDSFTEGMTHISLKRIKGS